MSSNHETKQEKLPKYKVTHKVSIQFKNLTYTATTGLFVKKKKTILKGVNGEFKSGEFSAILGTSGAGKSTLLNILSGFTTLGVEGEIYDNGQIRDPNEFAKLSCYIMQDDRLHSLLTVYESMMFGADLKLPSSMPLEEKQKRVEVVLKSLGLYEHKNTLTKEISGGQRRRLSIGIELIHNPPVLFLDEPTSGLDEVTAKQTISLLSDLAKDGRTIVCTIHTPSASILEKFDHLYCLVDGKCTYQGSVKGLIPYFMSFEPPLQCPITHNPADFLLEVCRGMYGEVYETMIQKCANGEISVKESEEVGLVLKKEDSPDREISDFCLADSLKGHKIYATSFLHQTWMIIKRVYLMMSRDRQLTFYRLFLHTLTGICVGLLYYQIGDDGRYTLDNFHFIFFTFLFIMYISFCSMLVAFSEEMPILIREHFNSWYSVKSYLVGVTLADLPVQLIATSIYICIAYFMTGQPIVWFRFLIFVVMCFLNSLVSQSMGMLFSAYVKLKIGVVLGPVTLVPFLVFSGYFIHMRDAPYFTHWAFHTSFVRYALEGAIQGVMGYDRGKFDCPGLYCHFVYPNVFLEQIGMTEPRIVLDVCVLLLYYVGLKIASYLALMRQVGGKK